MKERIVRLFISSTFRDMNSERDYLNNIVFPQVREYCKSRYIDFMPVDLRWGIPEEASRNGLVLASCIEQVDGARPFFVGILGGRYGYTPGIDELQCNRLSIVQNRQWLNEMISKSASITEIEMEYAALRNFDLPHATFYIKNDKALNGDGYCEEEGSIKAGKLRRLKSKIRSQQVYPVHEYTTSQEMGDALLAEVIEMIKSEFPDVGDDYSLSVVGHHEASIARRAFSLCSLFSLEKHVALWEQENCPVLLFTGPVGSGTSNAMTNTVALLRRGHAERKIIYYDCECAPADRDTMDDFLDYLRLDENHVDRDQWALVAVDNASMFGMEQTDRMMAWIQRKPDNIHVMIAASTSLMADTLKMARCACITQQGLTREMQYEFIDHFTRRYGKELTREQQTLIVDGKHSNDPYILTLLLGKLVDFGSMELLEQRIKELVSHSERGLMFALLRESEQQLAELQLVDRFAQAIVLLAQHGEVGVTEEDLLEITSMPMSEWAVIRPLVHVFCHGDLRRMRFARSMTQQDVKNTYSTAWMAQFGYNAIRWWFERCDERLNEAVPAMVNIYLFIWHLPFDNGEDTVWLEQCIRSLMLSPDAVLGLPVERLSNLCVFRWIGEEPFATQPRFIIGRRMDALSVDEKRKYYRKLIFVAEGCNRTADVSWCYRRLAALVADDSTQSILEKGRAFMAEGKPSAAISSVTGLWQRVTGNAHECMLKRMLRADAFVAKGDIRAYMHEVEKVVALTEAIGLNNLTEEEDNELAAFLIKMTFNLVFWGKDKEDLSLAAANMDKIRENHYLDSYSIANSKHFYYRMATTILLMRYGRWEDMAREAVYALKCAIRAYGSESYHAGRAHILCNYAYIKHTGQYYDNRSPYYNHYNTPNYLNMCAMSEPEPRVVQMQERENLFYDELVKQLQGTLQKR